MGWGIPRFWRRATAALALCGVIAYSGLFPGHIVSQLVTDLAERGFGHAAMAGCHDEGGPANPQPSNGAKKHCPFCTGYASFQLAAARLACAPRSAARSSAVMSSSSRTTWRSARAPLLRRAAVLHLSPSDNRSIVVSAPPVRPMALKRGTSNEDFDTCRTFVRASTCLFAGARPCSASGCFDQQIRGNRGFRISPK